MIKKFVIGKYYRYMGNAEQLSSSNEAFLLDRQWHRCIDTGSSPCDSSLEGCPREMMLCYYEILDFMVERSGIQLEFDF
jgi:hypothetical protein